VLSSSSFCSPSERSFLRGTHKPQPNAGPGLQEAELASYKINN
jgi:hypothetical protein